jgi:mannose-6-phosphate isomerase-like protein (cupin superfamily)
MTQSAGGTPGSAVEYDVAGMSRSTDPLEGRIARFAELEGNEGLFIDTVLPGGQRTIWSIIGQNVGEDRGARPAIRPEDFHLAILRAAPGNGAGLHTHTTVEVFMPLTGRWQLFYGEDEEHEVILDPWDVCSVPAGVWRGFRNAGDDEAHLLVVVGGTDAGRLTWAPKVLEEAARHGRTLDASGFMPD